MFETQRRWVIWQAALAHGTKAAAQANGKSPDGKAKGKDESPQQVVADESAVRNRVLNEVLDAFSELDDSAGMEGVLKVIQSLKKKQKATADSKSEG
ncbi:MAG: hypothetical protein ACLGI6_01780 [Gammaproteobacteria bacterium]